MEVKRMNQMINNGRQLTPAQRSAKNERDRQRRREQKTERQRLQKSETELKALLVTQRNDNTSLREENERLNDMISDLRIIINQLREQNRELHEKNLQLQETMKLADSFFEFDKSPSPNPNEEAANHEPITEGPGSSQSGKP